MSETIADRCHQQGLITVDEAIAQLLDQAQPVDDVETVAVIDALGRVLAVDVVSAIDVPGHDNSAMDGFAVRRDDCDTLPVRLKVTQRIPAGSNGSPLAAGEAARIFTGAPVPPGADAVVMQERCDFDAATAEVTLAEDVPAGDNIRRAGEDIAAGSAILASGTRLRQQELGLLASVGIREVPVYRRLRVGCFFTGDELIEPGSELAPGQIYNSNRYTLNGFLRQHGCDITDYGIVADNLDETMEIIDRVAQDNDLVLTSGGVSVGEEDFVGIALQRLGELEFWRIAMKPGKPVAFGRVGGALFLGLPGNPVSVFVTAQLFALPLMRRMAGERAYEPTIYKVTSGFLWPAVKRQEYLRARLVQRDGVPVAEIYPQQGSGVLSSACWADGLVLVPIGSAIEKGDPVHYIALT